MVVVGGVGILIGLVIGVVIMCFLFYIVSSYMQ